MKSRLYWLGHVVMIAISVIVVLLTTVIVYEQTGYDLVFVHVIMMVFGFALAIIYWEFSSAFEK